MQAITRISVFTSFALLLTASICSTATACDGYRGSYSYSNYAPVRTYSYSGYGYGYGCGTNTFTQRNLAPATNIVPAPAASPVAPAPSAAPLNPAPVTPEPTNIPGPSQVDVTPVQNPIPSNPIPSNPNQASPRDVGPAESPAPVVSSNPNQANPQFGQ
ncbi:MAG: hypothetical protein KDA93_10330 [Planctomycetaceae bacterium]|nr:hypothetical protein [Planctomycetaceae bacterium]